MFASLEVNHAESDDDPTGQVAQGAKKEPSFNVHGNNTVEVALRTEVPRTANRLVPMAGRMLGQVAC